MEPLSEEVKKIPRPDITPDKITWAIDSWPRHNGVNSLFVEEAEQNARQGIADYWQKSLIHEIKFAIQEGKEDKARKFAEMQGLQQGLVAAYVKVPQEMASSKLLPKADQTPKENEKAIASAALSLWPNPRLKFDPQRITANEKMFSKFGSLLLSARQIERTLTTSPRKREALGNYTEVAIDTLDLQRRATAELKSSQQIGPITKKLFEMMLTPEGYPIPEDLEGARVIADSLKYRIYAFRGYLNGLGVARHVTYP